jgi:hypothetical protein
VEVRLPADLMALLRHYFAIAADGETRAATLNDGLPRQIAFLNRKRVALGIFPVTSGASVFWGFSDAVTAAPTGRMPGIPIPVSGGYIYGSAYIGPVWLVAAAGSAFPLDVRVVEHSEVEYDPLTGR